MTLLSKFIKLMKGEPARKRATTRAWVIDEKKCLSQSEVVKLISIAVSDREYGSQNLRFSRIRDWFMIELGLNAGLRVAEMASLKHGDLMIDDVRSSIRVLGKGNKRRVVWINTNFKKMCQSYLILKAELGFSTEPASSLLPNLKDRRISKRALQKFFKRIASQANLSATLSIHCLRHTYATFLLKASNYNYRFVQQQLGHSSIRTTQVYAGVVESDGRRALEKMYR